MAQKKKRGKPQGQQFMSDGEFLKQKMRSYPIGKCYITDRADEMGIGNIIVTRMHSGGKISMGYYDVDFFCRGVTDSLCALRIEVEDFEKRLGNNSDEIKFHECTYEEAHNRIYGAIAFAEEAGIKPHPTFLQTQYILEEDTDDIPLIEYEFGKDGKHALFCFTQKEADRYLPLLKKNLGEGNYVCIVEEALYGDEDDDEDFYDDDEEDDDFYYHDEDDEYILDLTPFTIAEGLKVLDYDVRQIHLKAFLLGLNLPKEMSLEETIKAYVDAVLSDPNYILSCLPQDDIDVLEEIEETHSIGKPVKRHRSSTLMIQYLGFAKLGVDDDGDYVLCVATDFAKAMLPHLKGLDDNPAHKARILVEHFAAGLANLYGEARLDVVKKTMQRCLKIPEEAVTEMFEIAIVQSAWIKMYMNFEDDASDEEMKDSDCYFLSPYAWDDEDKMRDWLMEARNSCNLDFKEYTQEEIMLAAFSRPLIPNENSLEFSKFLNGKLGYGDVDDIFEIQCELWSLANHEDEEKETAGGNPLHDYIEEEILDCAPKNVSKAVRKEAIEMLNEFVNNIPRWNLCGHAPCEV